VLNREGSQWRQVAMALGCHINQYPFCSKNYFIGRPKGYQISNSTPPGTCRVMVFPIDEGGKIVDREKLASRLHMEDDAEIHSRATWIRAKFTWA
jgi:Asp-tRNA(Asn)/Glu-tRNA(Gln) amidotransferase B subunit